MNNFLSSLIITLLALAGCAHKNQVAGTYVGLYELNLGLNVSCHFLQKKRQALPSVLCHDQTQAWVVPVPEFKNHFWHTPPLLTQSGTVIAFLYEEKSTKVEVLVSTDKGKSWDVYPAFVKKVISDDLESISINQ